MHWTYRAASQAFTADISPRLFGIVNKWDSEERLNVVDAEPLRIVLSGDYATLEQAFSAAESLS